MMFNDVDLRSLIKYLSSKNKTKVIVGNCYIEYFGRARSYAPSCNRLIIIKPDGSVIIHEKYKREPVNWQPPGTKVRYEVNKNGNLVIESIRYNPYERLKITFNSITFIGSFDLDERSDYFKLLSSEKDIIKYILRNPSVIDNGLKIIGTEVRIEYGVIDILAKDKNNNIVVIEVKRSKGQLQHVSQLERYVEYFKRSGNNVRGILLANGITEKAYKFLSSAGLEFRDISKIIEIIKSKS